MIETSFNQFIRKYNVRLIFLILVGIFISETGFAPNFWLKSIVNAALMDDKKYILLTVKVYDYSFGPNFEHGYLEYCHFEASFYRNRNFFHLMDVETPLQKKSEFTKIIFKNKLENASIYFVNDIIAPLFGLEWAHHLKSETRSIVANHGVTASSVLKWYLNTEYMDLHYIKIKGCWRTAGQSPQFFNGIVYDLTNPVQSKLISNTQDTITKESEKDIVHILRDSESVVIKGAELGANIKLYNTAGVELQSTISKSDAVNIELPAKQIYIVQIGKSRYKVTM